MIVAPTLLEIILQVIVIMAGLSAVILFAADAVSMRKQCPPYDVFLAYVAFVGLFLGGIAFVNLYYDLTRLGVL